MNMVWFDKVAKMIESDDVTDLDLYILKAGDFYKIGRTKDIHKRINHLRQGCPYKIEICRFLRGKGYVEGSIHLLLCNANESGEWFNNSIWLEKLLELTEKYSSKPVRHY